MHPRNRHQGHYSFPTLIGISPELSEFMITNPYGKPSLDFANPLAVKALNRALLQQQYGIVDWDIPEGYLCPPIPGRADYIHGMADVLAEDLGELPYGPAFRALDIGCGANCIYPLVGQSEYQWRFIASDIDPVALANAQTIVKHNKLSRRIRLRLQENPEHIFTNILRADEQIALTFCNPPFHSSQAEALSGSRKKWRNLGKQDPSRTLPKLNFGGQHNELWCEGGERQFLLRMAVQSVELGDRVAWFSSLVSKAGNVDHLHQQLKRLGATNIEVRAMGQGNKQSRFVAWSFQGALQRRAFLKSLMQTAELPPAT